MPDMDIKQLQREAPASQKKTYASKSFDLEQFFSGRGVQTTLSKNNPYTGIVLVLFAAQ